MEVIVIASATLVTSKGVSMKNKRLIIVRVNTILSQDKQALIEEVRQRTLKQLKEGVIVTDYTCEVSWVDYDGKKIEVKVIDKDAELIAENKDKQ